MKVIHQLCAGMLVLLLLSPVCHAEENAKVATWVENVLLSTLTIDYKKGFNLNSKARFNYLNTAWAALNGFFEDYNEIIHEQKLSLHPFVKGPPVVERTGYAFGIHFWRVNQVIVIPELHVQIDFSIVVLETAPDHGGNYVIQSMNMRKLSL